MADDIVKHNLSALVDAWIEAEQRGVCFSVPFDAAWPIVGYSTKSNAKRGLKGLRKGKHFSSDLMKSNQRGRSTEVIMMTCDAFKHFCLMAETDEGEAIRDYFIEAEKKWKLVQQHAPEIAQEIEVLRLKQEIAKQEAIRAVAEQKAIELRHYVVSALPEVAQQKILGYQTIEKNEFRDRIIYNDEVINDGSTIMKGELCRRYGFLTKNGKPDYKALNKTLDDLPSEAFGTVARIQENPELKREWLPVLDKLVVNGERQRYIGE